MPGLRSVGPYEILAPLGSGGMGEVYRARDTRLGRLVAIKVLNGQLGDDPVLRDRFEREAKALAGLNHPHICALYDVGRESALDYLVMEYLEGQTLEQKLEGRTLTVDEAILWAMQIAEALDQMHRRGILHRDIKPANIMLTASGAKLMDFGLAKTSRRTIFKQGTPTVDPALTMEGALVGTMPYMAPEQLAGTEVDARTDIFALGCVLYQMIAGRPPFQADSQAGLIAAILSSEPERPSVVRGQPGAVSHLLDHVVEQCLAKDPDERWQTARDLMLQLEWIGEAGVPNEVSRLPLRRETRVARWISALLAMVLLGIAVLLTLDYFRGRPQPTQVVRASILPPSDYFFQPGDFSVSPDGTRLAFVGVGRDGKSSLWIRTFSSGIAEQLNGTDDAKLPFWAPDSRRIGFFAQGKLNTVDSGSGTVRILCEAPLGRCGATWGRGGIIVFAPYVGGALYQIPESGGVSKQVTRIPRQGSRQRHTWPFFLPDGKHFLYCVDWSSADDAQRDGIYVGSLDASPPKLVSSEITGNVAFVAGHLLYGQDRSLRAQPFDRERFEATGSAVSIAEQDLQEDPTFSHSEFAAAQNGVLVFQSLTDSVSKLIWFDRSGRELSQIAEIGYRDPRLSPDGQFLAISSDDARNGKYFIRAYDLARGVSTRLTESGNYESSAWSRDGRRIVYGASDDKSHHLSVVPADGASPPQILLKGAAILRHPDWSPDGHLVFTDFSERFPFVKVYSVIDRHVVPFARGGEARFSPDGNWIAYTGASDVSTGPTDVFVQPFPGPGGHLRISGTNGAQPVWARDGKQIFYITSDRKLMAVSFDPQHKGIGGPRVLFQTRIIAPNFFSTQYDVSADGRFLINSVPANYSSPLTLLTGWSAP